MFEAGGRGRKELKRWPPPLPAALRVMNLHEKKPRQQKNITIVTTLLKLSNFLLTFCEEQKILSVTHKYLDFS